MYTTSSRFQAFQNNNNDKGRTKHRRDVNLQPSQKTSSPATNTTFSSSIVGDQDRGICRRRSTPLNPIREDHRTPFRRSALADRWLQRYQIRPPPSSSVESEKKKKKKKKKKEEEKEKHRKQSVETGEEEEEGLKRTKSKTMKVYDHLKKAKCPISPGRRIAAFLNSLFHSSTPRSRPTVTTTPAALGVGLSIKTKPTSSLNFSTEVYTPSLSKTPVVKKSVRFSPELSPVSPPQVMRRKWEEEEEEEEEEEDSGSEEDAYSCGSSDLFELENLIGVGGRYRGGELPVYEMTTTTTTTTSGFLV